MFHEDRTKFEFDYESGSSSSYLVIKTDANSEMLNYQIEMITSNPCSSMLSIEKRQINEKVNLYYNITSLSTLEYYLKRKTLNRNDFITILRGVIKAVSDSSKYFLNENSFIMDEKYIFVNPATSEIALTYVPLKIHDDINNNYKALVSNMILNTVNFDEGPDSNAVPHILNYLRSDGFNLASFDKLLGGLEGKLSTENSLKPRQKTPKVQPKVPLPEEIMPVAAAITRDQMAVVSEAVEKGAARTVYKKTNLLIAGLMQVFVAITIMLMLKILSGINAEDRVSTAGGVALILGALDFLLLRRLLDKKLMIDSINVPASKPGPKVNMAKREICNKPINCDPPTSISANTVIHSSQNSLDTIVLDDGAASTKFAYLTCSRDGIVEKITINKQSFIFGRLKDQVDYVSQNNAVGKIHAELIMLDGQYFIKDLNSKNGTRVNGKRISSNTEYEIKNSDRIAFANSEYIFVNE